MDGAILRSNAAFRGMAVPPELTAPAKFQQVLSKAGAIFYETQFVPALRLRGALKEVALDLLVPGTGRLPVLINANLQLAPSGEACAVRMTLFEASERRSYEAELLRSRNRAERMAEVVQHTTDAIIALTPAGVIQSWNLGAEQMFGFTHGEVIGHELAEVILPEARHREVTEALALLGQGLDVTTDTTGCRKDGHELQLSVNLTPHMEAPGTLVGFSAIIRDITSRKQTEKALLQSEKLASVGRLASSIAHEINNPLESITNLLYILDGMATDPEMKQFVNTAQDEVARVSHIATHTLRFHKQSSNRTSLDVGELFTSILVLYRARLLNSGITATIDSSDTSPLFCFEGELRQIFANLVGNAFDAMRMGGRLRLRSRQITLGKTGSKGIRLTIADSGTGISAEILPRIFEPFFSTKGIGGTGLGLWITQELMEKNNGFIRMRSSVRPQSSGTVVCLFFEQSIEYPMMPTTHC